MQHIILASQSPRRKQLLEWAEIPFEIIVKPTDETYPSDLEIEKVPEYIAANKAKLVHAGLKTSFHQQYADALVLAADTVVVLNDRIIGKPKDRDDAVNILHALSGNVHRVITGVVIMNDDTNNSLPDITKEHFHTL